MKEDVPLVVGVPEIEPEESSVIPEGKDPLTRLHEYGVVPPLAWSVAEYPVPTVAFGNAAVEMANVPFDADVVLPVTPAHPSRIAIDMTSSVTSMHLRLPFPRRIRSRASMVAVPLTARFNSCQMLCPICW